MMQVDANQLTEGELVAWRGFLRVHAALVRQLDGELEREHGLPLTSYEVLLTLEAAAQRRVRMTELAGSLLLSQSGVTRLVDRLERAGLVQRVRCDSDRRGLYAALTDTGLARLREARPTHLAGVRRLFLARLSATDRARLAEIWAKLAPASI